MTCDTRHSVEEVKAQLDVVQDLLLQENAAHQQIVSELQWMKSQLAAMGNPAEVKDASELVAKIKKRAAIAAGFATGIGLAAGTAGSENIRNGLHKLIDLLGGV